MIPQETINECRVLYNEIPRGKRHEVLSAAKTSKFSLSRFWHGETSFEASLRIIKAIRKVNAKCKDIITKI